MSTVSIGRDSIAWTCWLQAVSARISPGRLAGASSSFILFLPRSQISRDVNQHGVHYTVTMCSARHGRLSQGHSAALPAGNAFVYLDETRMACREARQLSRAILPNCGISCRSTAIKAVACLFQRFSQQLRIILAVEPCRTAPTAITLPYGSPQSRPASAMP